MTRPEVEQGTRIAAGLAKRADLHDGRIVGGRRSSAFFRKMIRDALLVVLMAAVGSSAAEPRIYRAVLVCPGGEIPFLLELSLDAQRQHAVVINGSERIEISNAEWRGQRLALHFEHYDATIEAVADGAGREDAARLPEKLRGKWRKRSSKDKWVELDFVAQPFKGFRFPGVPADSTESSTLPIVGRWAVQFSKSDDPAVGVFKRLPDGQIEGTFLTTTGDYGFLAGSYIGGRLRLSSFDGAHAFLFDARVQADGTLQGDFWSRDAWHETWTARRDEAAALPDPFGLTQWSGGVALSSHCFPDLEGSSRCLDEPAFQGKVRVIEVFGTGCPNCNDASHYLADLYRRYRDRGLQVIGLAFELTGDRARDAEQVRRFARRHGVEYPLLLAGTNEKSAASAALPILDRLRGYPTTILLRSDGTARAVHTGFSGPATGEEYELFRKRFETMIEELLSSG